jgi:hypothetical protein
MRLWSIHPKYLDGKGLVALWREGLLAKNVLKGNTRGYKNHPQLNRFIEYGNPIDCINQYLESVYEESLNRGYSFNRNKIDLSSHPCLITVTDKQVEYEFQHLLRKLKIRSPLLYRSLASQKEIVQHPLFKIVKGEIENWEIL